ncbi:MULTISPECIES: redoxin domain-containing protein [unclassified Paenibacillus]|uniref:redoxin domain-containing protein n=1 Tax=unclassified Paenibacillus TaxID=185978 RepID=UPI003632C73F
MRKNKKWLQATIFTFVLLVGIYIVVINTLEGKDSVTIGTKAPDFTVTGLDGQMHDLSQYKGKPLIINFWGTFCPPCVREMPALQSQYDKWKDQNVQIVGMNLNESPVTVKAYLQQYNITLPILLDNDVIRKKYKVFSYPTTFYIDANGIIQDIFVGEMSENDVSTRINRLLR